MNRNVKRAKKIIYRHLDKIYSSTVKISKQDPTGMIPLTVLRKLIDAGQFKPEVDLSKDFVDNYNSMLDKLYDVCADNASRSGFIHPGLLKTYISFLKKSFSDGLELQ